jgi:hypothetical protein
VWTLRTHWQTQSLRPGGSWGGDVCVEMLLFHPFCVWFPRELLHLEKLYLPNTLIAPRLGRVHFLFSEFSAKSLSHWAQNVKPKPKLSLLQTPAPKFSEKANSLTKSSNLALIGIMSISLFHGTWSKVTLVFALRMERNKIFKYKGLQT